MNLLTMKKIFLYLIGGFFALASTGSALAYNKFITEVNDACGYDVITDCTGCHDASGDYKIGTYEKDLYLADGACGFCTENTACNVAPPTVEELYAYARNTVTLDYFEDIFGQFMTHMQASMQAVNADPNDDLTDPFAHVFPECPKLAATIASDHSRLTGNLVRRVTTKTRNQRNIPDAWELEQLLNFEQRAADGEPRNLLLVKKPGGPDTGYLPSKEFEAFEVVTEEIGKGKNKVEQHYFRYMRSLTMAPMPVAFGGPAFLDEAETIPNPNLPCLKCHGTDTQVSQGVKDAIFGNEDLGIEALYPYDTALGYSPGEIRGAWSVKIPLSEAPQ